MTNGGFVRLIFCKDVRQATLAMGFILCFAVITALFLATTGVRASPPPGRPLTLAEIGSQPFPNGFNAGIVSSMLSLVPYFLVVFVVIEAVVFDSPARGSGFLSTRPVGWKNVFFAKLLFIALLVIVTGWGFQELDYAVLGIRLQPLDHVCLLLESTIHLGAQMAFVVAFALFLRSKPQVFMGLLTFFVVLLGLVYLMATLFPGADVPLLRYIEVPSRGSGLMILLSDGLFIGVVLVVAGLRYRSHEMVRPLALLAGGLAVVALVCTGADHFSSRLFAKNQSGLLPAHLNVRIETPNSIGPRFEREDDLQGLHARTVVEGVAVEGVEPPYYFQVMGSHGVATLRSGKVIPSLLDHLPEAYSGSGAGITLEAALLGVDPGGPGVSFAKPGISLQAFTYLSSLLPAHEDLTGVTIQGEVRLQIRRAYISGSIPLEPGAVFTPPRQRYAIREAARSGQAIFLNMETVQVPLALRGDTASDAGPLPYVLFSPSGREMLGQNNGSSSSIVFPVKYTDSAGLFVRPGSGPPAPGWLQGAEVVFFGNENCGEVTVPYRLDNVTLTR